MLSTELSSIKHLQDSTHYNVTKPPYTVVGRADQSSRLGHAGSGMFCLNMGGVPPENGFPVYIVVTLSQSVLTELTFSNRDSITTLLRLCYGCHISEL